MNLKNKIVVITGGNKGLGRALTYLFLNEGAKVVVNSRSKKELQDIAKKFDVIVCAGDVTREKDMQKLADFTVKKFGNIDVWINNAGIGMGHLQIEEIDSKRAREVMEVNFWGTFYGSRSAMKCMKKQKYGIIVNIISSRAIVPSIFSAIYSSSKWAVRGFTKLLREALEPKNISVIAVYPTGIKTDFFGKDRPVNYKNYMEPLFVAQKIIQNLKSKNPKEELIIKKK